MRNIAEIKENKTVTMHQSGPDGMDGWITMRGKIAKFVCSWGGGWDHVSVSMTNRCPTWDEMCKIKDIFFREDECCVEYHPAKKDYVNVHPFCLHIWRPQKAEMPTLPVVFA